jgi:hypothetical protein
MILRGGLESDGAGQHRQADGAQVGRGRSRFG